MCVTFHIFQICLGVQIIAQCSNGCTRRNCQKCNLSGPNEFDLSYLQSLFDPSGNFLNWGECRLHHQRWRRCNMNLLFRKLKNEKGFYAFVGPISDLINQLLDKIQHPRPSPHPTNTQTHPKFPTKLYYTRCYDNA